MMESLIRQFYVFFFIALFSSWIAAVWIEEPTDKIIKKQTLSYTGKLCPPFGLGVRYEVSTIQTATTMFGCAYLEHNHTILAAPVFNLWLERPGKTSNHGHCKDMRNMDHFTFECISKKEPTKKEEISKGWHYVTLLDHSQSSISQDDNNPVFRCAVYEVNDAPAESVKIIRMVISAPSKEQMHEDLCASLSRTMAKDDLPYTSEGHRTWPDESVYLYMLGKPSLDGPPRNQKEIVKYPTSRPMKSTTTTQLTTMELTTTKPIRTTRYNKKLMEYLDSRTTTTIMPDPQDIFDYLHSFVIGRE
ncbi:hypothetical protein AGLY_001646 [Aphis glycines]|uniref:Uncharacterized protein n=1 Tax=Aphis glycines TaxID=307491 RepID=A0A6G0U4S8_APHGL|nr:hypothetical protein AGLY_001646 [Aphis glycines]